MQPKPIKVIVSFIFLLFLGIAQATKSPAMPALKSATGNTKSQLVRKKSSAKTPALLNIEGWGNIVFGLPYSQAKKKLVQKFPEIIIEGDDLLDLPEPENTQSIRTKKTTFFDEMSLFFDKNEKLYLVHLQFSRRHFSFLTLLQRLKKKYGTPTTTSFHNIVWKGKKGNIELFRTLVVRYIRKDVAEGKKENQEQWNKKSDIEQAKKMKKEDVLNTL